MEAIFIFIAITLTTPFILMLNEKLTIAAEKTPALNFLNFALYLVHLGLIWFYFISFVNMFQGSSISSNNEWLGFLLLMTFFIWLIFIGSLWIYRKRIFKHKKHKKHNEH